MQPSEETLIYSIYTLCTKYFINSSSDLFLLALLVLNNNFLQDILENDDIQLDLMFIASIVFDIIRVSYWPLNIHYQVILSAKAKV